MNLQAMFPDGRWNEDRSAYLVRKGWYDWHAAEVKDGTLALTDFGKRFAKEVPQRPILGLGSRRRQKE